MAKVVVLPSGGLKVAGKTLFPIGISMPPPIGGKTPAGRDGFEELAAAGVTFVRTGTADWNGDVIDAQLAAERKLLDRAAATGLRCWTWLGDLPDLPLRKPGDPPSAKERVLTQVVNAFKGHAGAARLEGRRRAAQPVSRRQVDPPGRPRARLRAA